MGGGPSARPPSLVASGATPERYPPKVVSIDHRPSASATAGEEPGWVDQLVAHYRRHWAGVALGLVDDDRWERIDRLVRRQTGVHDWVKVNVYDDVLAGVYSYTDALYTYDHDEIKKLADLVGRNCTRDIAYRQAFPAGRGSRGELAACRDAAIRYIDDTVLAGM